MCWCEESLSWDTCELIFTHLHKQKQYWEDDSITFLCDWIMLFIQYCQCLSFWNSDLTQIALFVETLLKMEKCTSVYLYLCVRIRRDASYDFWKWQVFLVAETETKRKTDRERGRALFVETGCRAAWGNLAAQWCSEATLLVKPVYICTAVHDLRLCNQTSQPWHVTSCQNDLIL